MSDDNIDPFAGSGTSMVQVKGGFLYGAALIRERGEMLCLTEMWKAAGADPSRQPAEWLRSVEARRFADFLAESLNLGNSQDGMVKVQRGGRNPATWAHWQIAMAYAKYLSPAFHAACNTIVRAHMEGRSAHVEVTAVGEEVRHVLGGMMKSVVFRIVADCEARLAERLGPLGADFLATRDRVTALHHDPAVLAWVEYRPAIAILKERDVPQKGRRRLSQRVSTRLRRFCLGRDRGDWIRLSRETGRHLFHVDAVNLWLAAEGEALIVEHKVHIAGQGVLPFPRRRPRVVEGVGETPAPVRGEGV